MESAGGTIKCVTLIIIKGLSQNERTSLPFPTQSPLFGSNIKKVSFYFFVLSPSGTVILAGGGGVRRLVCGMSSSTNCQEKNTTNCRQVIDQMCAGAGRIQNRAHRVLQTFRRTGSGCYVILQPAVKGYTLLGFAVVTCHINQPLCQGLMTRPSRSSDRKLCRADIYENIRRSPRWRDVSRFKLVCSIYSFSQLYQCHLCVGMHRQKLYH